VEIGGVRAFVQTLPFVCPSWHILRIPLKHLDWLPRPPPRLLEITPGYFRSAEDIRVCENERKSAGKEMDPVQGR
jgi:hypothetical protein